MRPICVISIRHYSLGCICNTVIMPHQWMMDVDIRRELQNPIEHVFGRCCELSKSWDLCLFFQILCQSLVVSVISLLSRASYTIMVMILVAVDHTRTSLFYHHSQEESECLNTMRYIIVQLSLVTEAFTYIGFYDIVLVRSQFYLIDGMYL